MRSDRETINAAWRKCYHRRQAALTPEERQAQRERYKYENHVRKARRAGKPLASVTYTNPGRVQLWMPTPEGVTVADLGYVRRIKRGLWVTGPTAEGPWSEEHLNSRVEAIARLRELYNS